MYNFYGVTVDKTDEWKALEILKDKAYQEGFDAGRAAGFSAGYAAAQGQPMEKIEAAYQQGVVDGQQRPLLRKNGVGY